MKCDSVCIAVDDYYDGPEFYSDAKPLARKEHKCCECNGTIAVGTRYFKASGKWDGVFETFRQCMPCHEIQQVFSCDGGFLFGGLWQAWDDANAYEHLTVHDRCFRRLSEDARQFLVNRWWQWKELQS